MDTYIICGFGTHYQITGDIDIFSEVLETTDVQLINHEIEYLVEVKKLLKIRELLKNKIETFLNRLSEYENGTIVSFNSKDYLVNLREDNNFHKAWLIDLYYLIDESIKNSQGVYFFNNYFFRKYESMSVVSMMRKFSNGAGKEQLFEQVNSVRRESRTKFELLDMEKYLLALQQLENLNIITVDNNHITLTSKGKLLVPKIR